ncbi:hypothetical protein Ahy_A04g017413 [Arachis hypogaea]|uniref:Uncharacterized protein n=1 Tax=Arachis hypogaea TaxID=3818 RepID=A0A445DAZ8_ARAHY|nr:hypothetical protein Ahy_A04g017413 [Arachis hypogaea]
MHIKLLKQNADRTARRKVAQTELLKTEGRRTPSYKRGLGHEQRRQHGRRQHYVVNVAATVVSIYGVDKWGKRALFLEGRTQMIICQAVVAAAIGAKFRINENPGALPVWYAIVVMMFICIYMWPGLHGHGVLVGGWCPVRSFHWKFV